MFYLGKRSLQRLEGVDERLVNVVKRAIQLSPIDFTVVEGLRTMERQKELYAQGRTKPGVKVTWTMKSKHLEGKAVDIAPTKGKDIDWDDCKKFDQLAEAMFAAAKELGVDITWGADWDRDGNPRERGETDSPHFQLA